jgi:hypothetical protein
LTGEPQTPKVDRNKTISASIVSRFGDIAVENLGNAMKTIKMYDVIVLANCRAEKGLLILNRGNAEELHAAAKAPVRKARKLKLTDDETEDAIAETFLKNLNGEVAKLRAERDERKKEVEELKALERVVDELLEEGTTDEMEK